MGILKALCALPLAAALLAAPAGAATMTANLSGDFNDHPIWESWAMTLTYETDGLQEFASPKGSFYEWTSASGTPSPLFTVSGFFKGVVKCGFEPGCTPEPKENTFSLTDFTSFRISQQYDTYRFYFTGPEGRASSLGIMTENAPPIDQPAGDGPGDYGYAVINGIGYDDMHVHGFSVTPSAIPEPGTWALMLAGVGLAGAAIRSRRRQAAI